MKIKEKVEVEVKVKKRANEWNNGKMKSRTAESWNGEIGKNGILE